MRLSVRSMTNPTHHGTRAADIIDLVMEAPHYALVAYIKDPVGLFVEQLRRDLHPELGHLSAHVTVLPPRPLFGTEEEADVLLSEVASRYTPFQLQMGEVETFVPATPTVFIRVAHAAYRMRELHDELNKGPLWYDEPWPYMPHLTIAKLESVDRVMDVIDDARRRWAEFQGPRVVQVERMTFVRGCGPNTWTDLSDYPLGDSSR